MLKKLALLILFFVLFITASGLVEAQNTCKVNDKVRVLWKGKWYPGTVKDVRGRDCYVNPDGYESNFNQWVGPDRIRYPKSDIDVGDVVYVFWKKDWAAADIIEVGDNKWKVHYKGHSNLLDEWVGPERIRVPKAKE